MLKAAYLQSEDWSFAAFLHEIIDEAEHHNCRFICGTQDRLPKFIFEDIDGEWILIDEYSGFFIHNNRIDRVNQVITMREFIVKLGAFNFNFSPIS